MNNQSIISQIDIALLDVEMPNTTRQLLIMLREEIPKAKTKEENLQIAYKWFELISTIVNIVSTVQAI